MSLGAGEMFVYDFLFTPTLKVFSHPDPSGFLLLIHDGEALDLGEFQGDF